ncbi:MAG: ABC transporter permease [Flavobacteriales bacterium]|nr:ABC transporter permease [Flavobacteriales bacterium]
MLTQISWRNIWRNKMRSWMVIIAIATGIWAVSFVMAFINSFGEAMVDAAIETQISHVQIHHNDFKEDKRVASFMDNDPALIATIKNIENVKAVTSRLVVSQAMIKTSKGTRGVFVKGINPESENEVTQLKLKLDTGNYFDGKGRNPIIVGKVLADKMSLKLRSSVVLLFQDHKGDDIRVKFRVKGIYSTGFAIEDRINVFVDKQDLSRILNLNAEVHEIAVLVDDLKMLPNVVDQLKLLYPQRTVETYKEVAPFIGLMEEQIKINMSFILGIILASMGFGIINTMLMAVLERTRELGMLMAIGMNKRKIFSMIMIETVLLALVGGPLGLLLGFLSVRYFNHVGVDFSAFSDALKQFGVNDKIRPLLDTSMYLTTLLAVICTALISSIYPAVKALKLKPAESI